MSDESAWPKLIPAEDVFNFVKGILENGKEKEFLALCTERNMRVSVLVDDLRSMASFVQANKWSVNSFSVQKVADPNKCKC